VSLGRAGVGYTHAVRIAVATMGSTGDVQPYLALTRALRTRGHDAFMLTGKMWESRVVEAGLPFRDSGNPANADTHERMLKRVLAEKNPARQMSIIFETLTESFRTAVPVTQQALRDADGVVVHSVEMSALAAVQALKKPFVVSHLFPGFLPARDWNPLGGNWGRLLNALVWKGLENLVKRQTDPCLNEIFSAAGLPPQKGLLLRTGEQAERILVAISPEMVSQDPLWGAKTKVTGYWFLSEPEPAPQSALARFVEGGEPPVVFTFGSMTGFDASRTLAAIVEGLGNRRAVLQAGVAQMGEGGSLPANVFRASFVPHGWLFPRAACVVHHGGAGTTSAVLRAGVPQAIVWHLGDQPTWGKLIARRGLSPAPIHHSKLTAAWVSRALRSMTEDENVRNRAKDLGARIRSEDGPGCAAKEIEHAFSLRSTSKDLQVTG